jgi:hypothetical protein
MPISLFSFQDLITSLSGILILLVLLMAVDVAVRKARPRATRPSQEVVPDVERLRQTVASLKEQVAAKKQTMVAASSQDAVAAAEQMTDAERQNAALQDRADRLRAEETALEADLAAERAAAAVRSREMEPLRENLAKLREALAKEIENDRRVFYIPEEGVAKTPIVVECSGSSIRLGFINRNIDPMVMTPTSSGFKAFIQLVGKYSPEREYFVFMIKPSGVDYWETLRQAAFSAGFDVGHDALEESKTVGFRTASL